MSRSIEYMHKKRFGGHREDVIKRDGNQCIECGMTREAHKDIFGTDITVHHKDGCGRNAKNPNNTMENLETLCLRCHGAKDAWRTGKYSEYAVSMKMKIQNIHAGGLPSGNNAFPGESSTLSIRLRV